MATTCLARGVIVACLAILLVPGGAIGGEDYHDEQAIVGADGSVALDTQDAEVSPAGRDSEAKEAPNPAEETRRLLVAYLAGTITGVAPRSRVLSAFLELVSPVIAVVDGGGSAAGAARSARLSAEAIAATTWYDSIQGVLMQDKARIGRAAAAWLSFATSVGLFAWFVVLPLSRAAAALAKVSSARLLRYIATNVPKKIAIMGVYAILDDAAAKSLCLFVLLAVLLLATAVRPFLSHVIAGTACGLLSVATVQPAAVGSSSLMCVADAALLLLLLWGVAAGHVRRVVAHFLRWEAVGGPGNMFADVVDGTACTIDDWLAMLLVDVPTDAATAGQQDAVVYRGRPGARAALRDVVDAALFTLAMLALSAWSAGLGAVTVLAAVLLLVSAVCHSLIHVGGRPLPRGSWIAAALLPFSSSRHGSVLFGAGEQGLRGGHDAAVELERVRRIRDERRAARYGARQARAQAAAIPQPPAGRQCVAAGGVEAPADRAGLLALSAQAASALVAADTLEAHLAAREPPGGSTQEYFDESGGWAEPDPAMDGPAQRLCLAASLLPEDENYLSVGPKEATERFATAGAVLLFNDRAGMPKIPTPGLSMRLQHPVLADTLAVVLTCVASTWVTGLHSCSYTDSTQGWEAYLVHSFTVPSGLSVLFVSLGCLFAVGRWNADVAGAVASYYRLPTVGESTHFLAYSVTTGLGPLLLFVLSSVTIGKGVLRLLNALAWVAGDDLAAVAGTSSTILLLLVSLYVTWRTVVPVSQMINSFYAIAWPGYAHLDQQPAMLPRIDPAVGGAWGAVRDSIDTLYDAGFRLLNGAEGEDEVMSYSEDDKDASDDESRASAGKGFGRGGRSGRPGYSGGAASPGSAPDVTGGSSSSGSDMLKALRTLSRAAGLLRRTIAEVSKKLEMAHGFRGPALQVDALFRLAAVGDVRRHGGGDLAASAAGAYALPEIGLTLSGISDGTARGALRPAVMLRTAPVGLRPTELQPWSTAASDLVKRRRSTPRLDPRSAVGQKLEFLWQAEIHRREDAARLSGLFGHDETALRYAEGVAKSRESKLYQAGVDAILGWESARDNLTRHRTSLRLGSRDGDSAVPGCLVLMCSIEATEERNQSLEKLMKRIPASKHQNETRRTLGTDSEGGKGGGGSGKGGGGAAGGFDFGEESDGDDSGWGSPTAAPTLPALPPRGRSNEWNLGFLLNVELSAITRSLVDWQSGPLFEFAMNPDNEFRRVLDAGGHALHVVSDATARLVGGRADEAGDGAAAGGGRTAEAGTGEGSWEVSLPGIGAYSPRDAWTGMDISACVSLVLPRNTDEGGEYQRPPATQLAQLANQAAGGLAAGPAAPDVLAALRCPLYRSYTAYLSNGQEAEMMYSALTPDQLAAAGRHLQEFGRNAADQALSAAVAQASAVLYTLKYSAVSAGGMAIKLVGKELRTGVTDELTRFYHALEAALERSRMLHSGIDKATATQEASDAALAAFYRVIEADTERIQQQLLEVAMLKPETVAHNAQPRSESPGAAQSPDSASGVEAAAIVPASEADRSDLFSIERFLHRDLPGSASGAGGDREEDLGEDGDSDGGFATELSDGELERAATAAILLESEEAPLHRLHALLCKLHNHLPVLGTGRGSINSGLRRWLEKQDVFDVVEGGLRFVTFAYDKIERIGKIMQDVERYLDAAQAALHPQYTALQTAIGNDEANRLRRSLSATAERACKKILGLSQMQSGLCAVRLVERLGGRVASLIPEAHGQWTTEGVAMVAGLAAVAVSLYRLAKYDVIQSGLSVAGSELYGAASYWMFDLDSAAASRRLVTAAIEAMREKMNGAGSELNPYELLESGIDMYGGDAGSEDDGSYRDRIMRIYRQHERADVYRIERKHESELLRLMEQRDKGRLSAKEKADLRAEKELRIRAAKEMLQKRRTEDGIAGVGVSGGGGGGGGAGGDGGGDGAQARQVVKLQQELERMKRKDDTSAKTVHDLRSNWEEYLKTAKALISVISEIKTGDLEDTDGAEPQDIDKDDPMQNRASVPRRAADVFGWEYTAQDRQVSQSSLAEEQQKIAYDVRDGIPREDSEAVAMADAYGRVEHVLAPAFDPYFSALLAPWDVYDIMFSKPSSDTEVQQQVAHMKEVLEGLGGGADELDLAKMGGEKYSMRCIERIFCRAHCVLEVFREEKVKATDYKQLRTFSVIEVAAPYRALDDFYLSWAASWAAPLSIPAHLRALYRRYAALQFMRAGLTAKNALQRAVKCAGPSTPVEARSSSFHALLSALASRVPRVEQRTASEQDIADETKRIQDLLESSNWTKTPADLRRIAEQLGDEADIAILKAAADSMEERRDPSSVALRSAVVSQLEREAVRDQVYLDPIHVIPAKAAEELKSTKFVQAPELVRAVARRLLLSMRRKGASDVGSEDARLRPGEGYNPPWLPSGSSLEAHVDKTMPLSTQFGKFFTKPSKSDLESPPPENHLEEGMWEALMPAYMYWCASPDRVPEDIVIRPETYGRQSKLGTYRLAKLQQACRLGGSGGEGGGQAASGAGADFPSTAAPTPSSIAAARAREAQGLLETPSTDLEQYAYENPYILTLETARGLRLESEGKKYEQECFNRQKYLVLSRVRNAAMVALGVQDLPTFKLHGSEQSCSGKKLALDTLSELADRYDVLGSAAGGPTETQAIEEALPVAAVPEGEKLTYAQEKSNLATTKVRNVVRKSLEYARALPIEPKLALPERLVADEAGLLRCKALLAVAAVPREKPDRSLKKVPKVIKERLVNLTSCLLPIDLATGQPIFGPFPPHIGPVSDEYLKEVELRMRRDLSAASWNPILRWAADEGSDLVAACYLQPGAAESMAEGQAASGGSVERESDIMGASVATDCSDGAASIEDASPSEDGPVRTEGAEQARSTMQYLFHDKSFPDFAIEACTEELIIRWLGTNQKIFKRLPSTFKSSSGIGGIPKSKATSAGIGVAGELGGAKGLGYPKGGFKLRDSFVTEYGSSVNPEGYKPGKRRKLAKRTAEMHEKIKEATVFRDMDRGARHIETGISVKQIKARREQYMSEKAADTEVTGQVAVGQSLKERMALLDGARYGYAAQPAGGGGGQPMQDPEGGASAAGAAPSDATVGSASAGVDPGTAGGTGPESSRSGEAATGGSREAGAAGQDGVSPGLPSGDLAY